MKRVRLGDYIEQIRGVSYKPTDLTSELGNSSISLLRANNISNGIIVPNELQYIKRAKVSQNQLLRVNDILMCTSSGSVAHVGKIALMTSLDEYTFGAFCKVIRTTHELFPQYVALFLSAQSTRRCIEHNAKGANINNLRNEDIDNLTIPYCSREIQQKICQRISAVKRFIHKRQMQLEKLDELVKARFVEMFGEPNLGFPCSDWVELRECGQIVSGSTPKTTDNTLWGGDYTWITPAELKHNSGIIYESERKLSSKGIKSAHLQKLPKGTVILTSRAPIGKLAIAGREMYCNQGFKNIICNPLLHPSYLYHLLLYNEDYLNSLGRGATFKELSKSIVENIKIKVPTLTEQATFAAFVKEVDKSKVVVLSNCTLLGLIQLKHLDFFH